MHDWGDSGITAVLFSIFLALVISFGVAQRARARAVRYQEIRRLQFQAAEQARREEAEAEAEYTSMVAVRHSCAVCFNPTTTRCSRCKAARYCSPACQMQHWKQGHKEDCRAPDVPSSGSSSNGSRNFSDAFSSGSSGSGSRTASEVSDVQGVEDGVRVETPKTVTANGTHLRPKEILFPYDYFVTLFNCERLKVPPCGLINCGNSCFANVVLQCLTYTRPLTAYLLEGSHGEECKRSDWCFMCELQDHVWRVRQSQNAFSPIRILSRIRHIGNHLGYGRQEDAHEFMRFAIDSMQSICLDEAGGEKAVDPRTQETTLVHHIFGGHLQSQVKCMQCLHESNRYENMMDLAVEIHGCVETLEDALTQFTTPEWLDGENKYKCDRCNDYVKARKRLTLHEAPNVLTIALKRFQSGKFGKLNKRVTFPEVLDISPYMSGKGDNPPLYRLYAVVVHVDMLNASFFGHYICYVKDSQELWYKIDDSKVKEVDLEKVMSQRAYMLFYTRSFARPPPLTDGIVAPYTVAHVPEFGRVSTQSQGGYKVFPAPGLSDSEKFPVSGAMGLHSMVEFRQPEADVEGRRDLDYTYSNGDAGMLQSSSWEVERISNDDGISVNSSGFVASSSSLTLMSPCISSYRSNHELWFPSQSFVCEVPGSGVVEDSEHVSWDKSSSPSSDFSDVNLHTSAVDKPSPSKVGKRRLDDGLSPLPTPKPLDTDQLPTWPSGSHARSFSCPAPATLSDSQTSCSVSSESYPSWQNYDSQRNGELLPTASCLVQHRMCSDQMCPTARGEPSQDLEHSDYSEVGTMSVGEEERFIRAKRQHVEVDNDVNTKGRIQRPDDKPQEAVKHLFLTEVGQKDMDCGEEQQRETSTLDAPCGPVTDPCVECIPVDTSQCSPLNVQQTFSPALGQIALRQVVNIPSPTLLVIPPKVTEAPQGENVCGVYQCDGSHSDEAGILQSRTECLISAPSCVVDVEKIDLGSFQNPNRTQGDGVVTVGSGHPPSPPLHDLPKIAPETSTSELGGAGHEFNTGLASSDQHQSRELVLEDSFGNHKSDMNAGKELVTLAPNLNQTNQGAEASAPLSTSPLVDPQPKTGPTKLQKLKAKPKPLFAPGFLNRVNTPGSVSKPTSSGRAVNIRKAGSVDSLPVNKTEGQLQEDEKDCPDIDQQCSPNGALVGPLKGQLGTASSMVVSNCDSATNSELCNSSDLPDVGDVENSNRTSNGLAPNVHENLAKMSFKNEDGSQSKARTATRDHTGNGVESAVKTSPASVETEYVVDPVREAPSSLGQNLHNRPATGKQKQGRNETCNCGSQRKWKKCCGKSGVLKPVPGRRRLVV